jgi:hypothetical protein
VLLTAAAAAVTGAGKADCCFPKPLPFEAAVLPLLLPLPPLLVPLLLPLLPRPLVLLLFVDGFAFLLPVCLSAFLPVCTLDDVAISAERLRELRVTESTAAEMADMECNPGSAAADGNTAAWLICCCFCCCWGASLANAAATIALQGQLACRGSAAAAVVPLSHLLLQPTAASCQLTWIFCCCWYCCCCWYVQLVCACMG